MARIKRLLFIFITIFFLFPIIVEAGTELGTTIRHPVVGSSIYVQLDLMYGDELLIRDFHTIIDYDPAYLEFERVVWLQNSSSASYSSETICNQDNTEKCTGYIYIDKEAGRDWTTGSALQLKFKVLKKGQTQVGIKRNGDSHYSDGHIIGQSFAGIYIEAEEPNSSTYLSSLSILGHEIKPTFNKAVHDYTLVVPSNVASITVITKKDNEKQEITGDGKYSLNYNENMIHVSVTAENGSTNTYNITVIRTDDRSGDTSLKSIIVGDEIIEAEPNVTTFEKTVTRSMDSVLLSAQTTDPYATLLGTGRKELNIGANEFTLTVETSDKSSLNNGLVTKDYKVIIYRSTEEFEIITESSKLQNLKVNNLTLDLSDQKTRWFYGVTSDYDELTINAIPESKTATYTIDGNNELSSGINIVTIKVTERKNITDERPELDSDSTIYTLVVYKSPLRTDTITNFDAIPTENDIFYRTTSFNDSIISKNTLATMKKNNQKLYYNVVNLYNGILYQALINPEKYQEDLDVSFKEESPNNYVTKLPKDVEILLNVSENFIDGTNIKIYTYNEGDTNYTLLTDGTAVQNGYIHFSTNGDTKYLLTLATLIEEQRPFTQWLNKYKIFIIIILLGCLVGIAFTIIKKKKQKQIPGNNIEY